MTIQYLGKLIGAYLHNSAISVKAMPTHEAPLESLDQQRSFLSASTSKADSSEDCIDVINAIRPEALLQVASDTRGANASTVSISEKPLQGTYNLVYMVTIADGVKHAARIPKHGTVQNLPWSSCYDALRIGIAESY